MADRIELELGGAPWRPTRDSELVTTYRYYDGPLLGVVRQHSNDYLFSCLDGENETLSLWFYAPISGEQQDRFASMSAEQFNAALPAEALTGNIVLAFATEGLGIVDHEAVEDSASASVAAARMRVALQTLRARLRELIAEADDFDVALV